MDAAKSGPSKLSMLRQRLKRKSSGPGQKQATEGTTASQSVDTGALGDGDGGIASEKPSETVAPKKKNESLFFYRASPMGFVRVCKAMSPAQKKLIEDEDFGELAGMKCSKLIPELCRFLMAHFDPDKCALDFGERGIIPITEESVHKVIGVPMGGYVVLYHLDCTATSLILEMLHIEDEAQPTVTSLELQLGPDHPADDDYLRKFVIYVQSSFFAPTTCIRISPRCYPHVINTRAIRRLNWARFVKDILVQIASAKDKKNWFKACMQYLMIHYVDSLETIALEVPQDGTRCCIWTNKMISTIAKLDMTSDGSYGRLLLKAYFKSRIALFSSDPTRVYMFLKEHLLGNHTDEISMPPMFMS